MIDRNARRLALAAITAALLGMAGPEAAAQSFPTKPVRLVVGFATGGITDIMARTVAPGLGNFLGQPVVVEAKPGADSLLASEFIAKAAPDGHTIYLASSAHAINATLYKNPTFSASKDFVTIAMLGEIPNIIAVHPSVPVSTLREFIELAKQKKGDVNYAATASSTYLAMELLNSMAGMKVTRIAYKGSAPATTAILAGEVQVIVTAIGPMVPFMKAGKLKGLAVSSIKRSQLMPDIPTGSEAGVPGYNASTWYAFLAPAKTPRDALEKLDQGIRRALADPQLRAGFISQGIEISDQGLAQLGDFLETEVQKWGKVIRDVGAKVD